MKLRVVLIVSAVLAVVLALAVALPALLKSSLECETAVFCNGRSVSAEAKHGCTKQGERLDLKEDKAKGFSISPVDHGMYNLVSDLSIPITDELSVPVQICVNYFHIGNYLTNADLKYSVYIENTDGRSVTVKTVIDFKRGEEAPETFEQSKTVDPTNQSEPCVFTFGFGS